jgi:hypothetical protein
MLAISTSFWECSQNWTKKTGNQRAEYYENSTLSFPGKYSSYYKTSLFKFGLKMSVVFGVDKSNENTGKTIVSNWKRGRGADKRGLYIPGIPPISFVYTTAKE